MDIKARIGPKKLLNMKNSSYMSDMFSSKLIFLQFFFLLHNFILKLPICRNESTILRILDNAKIMFNTFLEPLLANCSEKFTRANPNETVVKNNCIINAKTKRNQTLFHFN